MRFCIWRWLLWFIKDCQWGFSVPQLMGYPKNNVDAWTCLSFLEGISSLIQVSFSVLKDCLVLIWNICGWCQPEALVTMVCNKQLFTCSFLPLVNGPGLQAQGVFLFHRNSLLNYLPSLAVVLQVWVNCRILTCSSGDWGQKQDQTKSLQWLSGHYWP